MSFTADIQLLDAGEWIELLELDGSALGASILHFHAYTQLGSIWWQGNEYSPWPYEATGFDRTSEQQPVPLVNVANVDGSITTLCLLFEDLLGMKVTRRRTFGKYLDAATFTSGLNPTADPTQHAPDDVWYVERKAMETSANVQFELASALSFASRQLPGRQVIANACLWTTIGGYRGPYCGYTGGSVAKADDTATADPTLDKCGGRVTSCKLRFGANNQLPFGGVPGAGLVR